MQIISFTKVDLPYGWLGNMSRHAVMCDGRMWRTCEALFQAKRFNDAIVVDLIHAAASPMSAKMTAKMHRAKMVIEPQSSVDLDNMRAVLRLKIATHPQLGEQLRMTGDAIIVEDVSARPHGSGMFWGAQRLPDGTTWKGDNQLGKLWMELRAELYPAQLML